MKHNFVLYKNRLSLLIKSVVVLSFSVFFSHFVPCSAYAQYQSSETLSLGTQMKVEAFDDKIVIHTDVSKEPNMAVLKAPSRVMIDVPGVVLRQGGTLPLRHNSVVSSIRVGVHKDFTRIVLDISGKLPEAFGMTNTSDQIVITLKDEINSDDTKESIKGGSAESKNISEKENKLASLEGVPRKGHELPIVGNSHVESDLVVDDHSQDASKKGNDIDTNHSDDTLARGEATILEVPTETPTVTPSATFTRATFTDTPTELPSPTETNLPTDTPTFTKTPTSTVTSTPTTTPKNTVTPTFLPTATELPTETSHLSKKEVVNETAPLLESETIDVELQFTVNTLEVTFAADGRPVQDVIVKNRSDKALFMTTTVQMVVHPGLNNESLTPTTELIASPKRFQLLKGEERGVRLLLSKKPTDGIEHVYRVNLIPDAEPFDMQLTKGKVGISTGLAMLAVAEPKDAKPHLQWLWEKEKVTVTNAGNANVYLDRGSVCEQSTCTQLPAHRVYPGAMWEIPVTPEITSVRFLQKIGDEFQNIESKR